MLATIRGSVPNRNHILVSEANLVYVILIGPKTNERSLSKHNIYVGITGTTDISLNVLAFVVVGYPVSSIKCPHNRMNS